MSMSGYQYSGVVSERLGSCTVGDEVTFMVGGIVGAEVGNLVGLGVGEALGDVDGLAVGAGQWGM